MLLPPGTALLNLDIAVAVWPRRPRDELRMLCVKLRIMCFVCQAHLAVLSSFGHLASGMAVTAMNGRLLKPGRQLPTSVLVPQ